MITKDTLKAKGYLSWEFERPGLFLLRSRDPNTVTNDGIHHLLDVAFRDGTKEPDWYFGLINNAGYTALAPTTDVMDSHPGWTEFTAYDEAARQQWSPGEPDNRSITNGTLMVWNFNATGNVRGAFACSDDTKSGTTGVLWTSLLLANVLAVQNGDILRATYTLEVLTT